MFVKDLNSLKYAELQKLAKSVGIKANQKVDKLMKALKEHYMETEEGHENCPTDVTSDETTSEEQDKTTGQRQLPKESTKRTTGNNCESGSESEETTQELAAKPVSKDGPTKKRIARKVTSTSIPVRSPLMSPLQKMAASLAALRKGSKGTKKPIETLPADMATPPGSKGIKKRRRTFELDEPTLSAQNTPVLDDQAERRSTRQRTSQSDAPLVVQQDEPAKKRVRKNTYDVEASSPDGMSDGSAEQAVCSSTSSPGTRAMIEEIDVNLPSAERKQKLLSALDQKIKNKASTPARQGPNTQAQPSQIPRFMAFLANKKLESQKPVTPGNKDWTKIHSKEFSKFDSLDVYLERKQQRMEKLTGSAKRPTAVATRRQRPNIVKPVTSLQVPVASGTKPFVPSVTSTKNITFNFSKTPVALKTPCPTSGQASPTPRRPVVIASATKSVGTGKNTPFIFTGNNASHNTSVTSQKKTFDLKASLAKPLSWKPHTGRLQPLDTNKLQPAPAVVTVKPERPSRQAMASKTRPVNAKNVRRVEQLDRRNNQKYIDMMRRRGLLA
ncbi:hypothetical protein BsWGS_14662 [Bradybaena similaris]